MAGVNKVLLIGNLGKDPELRYTPGGQAVTSFPLATTERWADKTGQKKESTEWHNIVVWGKLAELCNQYLKKGRSAYIEGKITNRSWDDKDGNKKYKTEIVASQVQFLSSGPGQNDSGMPNEPSSGADMHFDQGPASGASQGIGEDDLPF